MNGLVSLAAASAWSRRFALSLVVGSIALASFLLVTLERVRGDLRQGFAQSVSGVDLIVGPRTAPVQLLLHAVFRLGDGSGSGLRWSSVERIAGHPAVAWSLPIALGDSMHGFPVLATTPAYFEHFRYGDRRPLGFADGRPFVGAFETVLGADVAEHEGHRVGDRITLSHGDGELHVDDHDDRPFTVVGVLGRTGTPVDRTVHIGLAAMQALHSGWVGGMRLPGLPAADGNAAGPAAEPTAMPATVSALLVGLHDRSQVLSVQREIAESRGEPLMAVLPGVALDGLWQITGHVERTLRVMGAVVAAVSLAGLVAVVLAGLEPRRRELAILRAIGASPRHVLALIALEGLLVTSVGVLIGLLLHAVALVLLAEPLQARFGVTIPWALPNRAAWAWLAGVLVCGLLASLVPAARAYRLSLADGLSPKD